MLMSTYLVRRGLISPLQLVEAIEMEQASRIPLGRLALELGKLTVRQVFQILSEQSERPGPFGRKAMQLGFLREEDLGLLLLKQGDRARSVTSILVDMGAIDAQTLAEETAHFYHEMSHHKESCELTAS